MTYINERAGYPPALNPVEKTIAWGVGYNAVKSNEHGLYSRVDIDPDFLDDVQERLRTAPSGVGLYDWQLHNQAGWKRMHGTYAAVERFAGKLDEEYAELKKELPEPYDNPVTDIELKERILKETGDMAWCIVALASNSSANIDHGTKNYLYEAVMGIRVIDSKGQYHQPVWREKAAHLATTNDRQLNMGDVDSLVYEGFVAEPSNRLNLFYIPGEEFDEDPNAYHYLRSMYGDVMALEGLAKRQYGYGETEMSECGEYHGWVSQGSYEALANEIRLVAAKMLFQLALVARKSCGGTLAEAVSLNSTKLTGRIVANLLDRTDGERPPELR